jgi:hypothetical protein
MANLPYVSQYIRACLIEEDYEKVFIYEDYIITPLTKTIPIKVGSMQVSSKPIPMEIQEHTSILLQKMISPPQKRAPSPSFSQTTTSTLFSSRSFASSTLTHAATHSAHTTETEQQFHHIETQMAQPATRMDNIENLCLQLKSSTDVISNQLSQLTSDLSTSSHNRQGSPLPKLARFS